LLRERNAEMRVRLSELERAVTRLEMQAGHASFYRRRYAENKEIEEALIVAHAEAVASVTRADALRRDLESTGMYNVVAVEEAVAELATHHGNLDSFVSVGGKRPRGPEGDDEARSRAKGFTFPPPDRDSGGGSGTMV